MRITVPAGTPAAPPEGGRNGGESRHATGKVNE